MNMRKNSFSIFRMGAGLALVLSLALITACPATDPDDTGSSREAGLYIGSSRTSVDLSTLAGNNVIDKSLVWLSEKAESDTDYTIVLGEDLSLTPVDNDDGPGQSAIFLDARAINEKTGVTVTLKSDAVRRVISLADKGNLLQVGGKVPDSGGAQGDEYSELTVILEDIVLKGLPSTNPNNAALVSVGGTGAVLIVKDKAQITGNYRKNTGEVRGSGVVIRRATLVLDGGSIDNNTGETQTEDQNVLGGGICVVDYGESHFIMRGGTITSNKAIALGGTARGAAVFISSGEFTMSGGTITKNHAQSATGNALGGVMGTWVSPRAITLTGGSVTGNTAASVSGAGVAFPGFRISQNVTLGGSVEITDPLVISAGVVFTLQQGFTAVNPILIDFNAVDAAAGASYITSGEPPLTENRVILAWAEGGTGDLPIASFKLNNWVGANPAVVIDTVEINAADGKLYFK